MKFSIIATSLVLVVSVFAAVLPDSTSLAIFGDKASRLELLSFGEADSCPEVEQARRELL